MSCQLIVLSYEYGWGRSNYGGHVLFSYYFFLVTMTDKQKETIKAIKQMQVRCKTTIVNLPEGQQSGIKVEILRKDNPMLYQMRALFQVQGTERKQFDSYWDGIRKERRLYKGMLSANMSSRTQECLLDNIAFFIRNTEELDNLQSCISNFVKLLVEQTMMLLENKKEFVINLTISE